MNEIFPSLYVTRVCYISSVTHKSCLLKFQVFLLPMFIIFAGLYFQPCLLYFRPYMFVTDQLKVHLKKALLSYIYIYFHSGHTESVRKLWRHVFFVYREYTKLVISLLQNIDSAEVWSTRLTIIHIELPPLLSLSVYRKVRHASDVSRYRGLAQSMVNTMRWLFLPQIPI